MKTGIYKITNLINGKSYIGQAINIEKRWKDHINNPFNINKKDYGCSFYQAIRKYGIENFQFEIIEECSKEELNDREIYWINHYHTWVGWEDSKGYNMTSGGFQPTNIMLKINFEILQNIIYLLQNTNLNHSQIADRYNLSIETIQGINTGRYYFNENINYPIRKKKTLKYEYCKVCGKRLSYNHKNIYCRECLKNLKINFKPIKNTFTKTQLLKDFYNLRTVYKVASFYNVSTMLIYKWCKKLEVEIQDKHKMEEQYKEEVLGEKISKKIKREYNKNILQIDPNTKEVIKIFKSGGEIEKELGFCSINIKKKIKRYNNELTPAYGYLWKFKD